MNNNMLGLNSSNNYMIDSDLKNDTLFKEVHEEEEEEEEEMFDFLPFQKEFLIPLRDRAFSWDVSFEDEIYNAENEEAQQQQQLQTSDSSSDSVVKNSNNKNLLLTTNTNKKQRIDEINENSNKKMKVSTSKRKESTITQTTSSNISNKNIGSHQTTPKINNSSNTAICTSSNSKVTNKNTKASSSSINTAASVTLISKKTSDSSINNSNTTHAAFCSSPTDQVTVKNTIANKKLALNVPANYNTVTTVVDMLVQPPNNNYSTNNAATGMSDMVAYDTTNKPDTSGNKHVVFKEVVDVKKEHTYFAPFAAIVDDVSGGGDADFPTERAPRKLSWSIDLQAIEAAVMGDYNNSMIGYDNIVNNNYFSTDLSFNHSSSGNGSNNNLVSSNMLNPMSMHQLQAPGVAIGSLEAVFSNMYGTNTTANSLVTPQVADNNSSSANINNMTNTHNGNHHHYGTNLSNLSVKPALIGTTTTTTSTGANIVMQGSSNNNLNPNNNTNNNSITVTSTSTLTTNNAMRNISGVMNNSYLLYNSAINKHNQQELQQLQQQQQMPNNNMNYSNNSIHRTNQYNLVSSSVDPSNNNNNTMNQSNNGIQQHYQSSILQGGIVCISGSNGNGMNTTTITTSGSGIGGCGMMVDGEYRIGAYTKQERQVKIEMFREKKRTRIWRKQIKYDCRKRLADTRPRVKGRFVSRKGENMDNDHEPNDDTTATNTNTTTNTSSAVVVVHTKHKISKAQQHQLLLQQQAQQLQHQQAHSMSSINHNNPLLPFSSSSALHVTTNGAMSGVGTEGSSNIVTNVITPTANSRIGSSDLKHTTSHNLNVSSHHQQLLQHQQQLLQQQQLSYLKSAQQQTINNYGSNSIVNSSSGVRPAIPSMLNISSSNNNNNNNNNSSSNSNDNSSSSNINNSSSNINNTTIIALPSAIVSVTTDKSVLSATSIVSSNNGTLAPK